MAGILSASHVIELRPLSVIHVWSGVEAITGVDIVYEGGGTACFVDFEGLPEELVKIMIEQKGSLEDLIASLAGKLPCKARLQARARPPARTRVKLLPNSIVPGSSLKGYIRTAILYYLASQLSPQELTQRLNSGVNLGAKLNRASEGFEAGFFRAPRLAKQGGFVDSFQSLLVSDPKPLSISLALDELMVYELPGFRRIASVYAETFSAGVLEYSVKILEPPRAQLVSSVSSYREEEYDYREEYNLIVSRLSLLKSTGLIEALRSFGCMLIESEVSRIKGIGQLQDYRMFLERLREKYCEGKGECTAARIGFMTGHQAKTILELVKKKSPQFYGIVKSVLSRHYGRIWDDLTVKLVRVDEELLGVGWCELCVRK